MRFTRLAIATGCLALAAGFVVSAQRTTKSPIAGYKTWRLVTPKPLDMDPTVVLLCAAPTPPNAFSAHTAGHQLSGKRFFRVYVNAAGTKAMWRGGTFPAGSTIVKEKLLPVGGSFNLELMTVMVKHAKGFNPKTRDWEFFVTDANGNRITSPKDIADCASCHRGHIADDMVFRTYVDGRPTSPVRG